MTQEEKQLLLKLKDLCARLPYGVKVRGVFINYNKDKDKILYEECDRELDYTDLNRYESLKPYLRPLSSMSDKEKEELHDKNILIAISTSGKIETTIDGFDWLNKKMFDYRGLIPKGLAIEAPEGMYNN